MVKCGANEGIAMTVPPSHDDDDDDGSFSFSVFTPAADDPSFDRPTLPQLTNTIRRRTRTLRNRLHSIHADSAFVVTVTQRFGLPLVANSRAGDWYAPPSASAGRSVYFKSTDGHAHEWRFSQRRLNLHLLEIVAEKRGAVVVDSTRRGKRFPDSLAKTIPAWIAVVNCALFPGKFPCGPVLHTTPRAVAAGEVAALEALLPRWVEEFKGLGLDLGEVARRVGAPLRPIFVDPESTLPEEGWPPPAYDGFLPVVLVTASRRVEGKGTEGEYIQGAGDDHEGWARESGLTPTVFWKHADKILAAGEEEIEKAVACAVAEGAGVQGGGVTLKRAQAVTRDGKVAVAAWGGLESLAGDALVVNCAERKLEVPGWRCIQFPVQATKKGNKTLRMGLPELEPTVRGSLEKGETVMFVCENGDDVAPAVALHFLCLFYDDEGKRSAMTFLSQGALTGDREVRFRWATERGY